MSRGSSTAILWIRFRWEARRICHLVAPVIRGRPWEAKRAEEPDLPDGDVAPVREQPEHYATSRCAWLQTSRGQGGTCRRTML